MINRILGFSFILYSILSLTSCDCDDSVTCPAFSPNLESYLVYNENDLIKFQNENGDEITFTVNNKSLSSPKTIDCKNNGLGCQCPSIYLSCTPIGEYHANTSNGERIRIDTIKNRTYTFNSLDYSIHTRLNNNGNIQTVFFTLLDANGSFEFTTEIKTGSNQIILDEFNAGGKAYTNVILYRKDLKENDQYDYPFNVDFISEVYIQPNLGIIAFYDLQTGSQFYLNN